MTLTCCKITTLRYKLEKIQQIANFINERAIRQLTFAASRRMLTSAVSSHTHSNFHACTCSFFVGCLWLLLRGIGGYSHDVFSWLQALQMENIHLHLLPALIQMLPRKLHGLYSELTCEFHPFVF